MSKHTAEDFKDAIQHMRTVCPPPKGFGVEFKRVDSASLGEALGDCSRSKNKYTIRVSKDCTLNEMFDVLIHEVAHMYDFQSYKIGISSDPHGSTWGVWYSKVYQRFHGVL